VESELNTIGDSWNLLTWREKSTLSC